MVDPLLRRFVPDDLWEAVAPVTALARRRGTARVDDRTVLAAIAFVLSTGCTWRQLPAYFGVAVPTAHRRFVEWDRLGLWRGLPAMAADPDTREWACALALAAEMRTDRRATGPAAVPRTPVPPRAPASPCLSPA